MSFEPSLSMKSKLLTILMLPFALLAQGDTNEIPVFSISASDVVQSSIYKFRFPADTNKFSIKFQYTPEGSNRARAFTEAHQNQKVRDKIGKFETPPCLLQLTNTTGRNGYHGISAKDADAIMETLRRQ
jgi:hypothetical protein